MKIFADTLMINAKAVTLDKKGTIAQAIAIKNGKILDIGSNDDLSHIVNKDTKIVDINGRLLLPGFNDSHIHPLLYGLDLLKIDCGSKSITTIKQIKENIRTAAQKVKKGEWILCSEYKPALLDENRKILKDELDSVAPDNPVFLPTIHAVSTNSPGLKLAGIDVSTPNPKGGEIERIKGTDEPNGFLSEAAVHLIIPKLPPVSDEDRIKALEAVGQELLSNGVTSVHEAGGVADIKNNDLFATYQNAWEQGRWKIRSYIMFTIKTPEHFKEIQKFGFHTGFGNDNLKVGSAKLFIDGAFALGKAAVYSEDGSTTDENLVWTPEQLAEMIPALNEKGWQVATHTQGDRAIDITLEAYKIHDPQNSLRNRIEHAAVSTPEIQQKFVDYNIPIATQPNLLHYFGAKGKVYGTSKQPWIFPFKTLLDKNLVLGGGSDCRATPAIPIMGIWNACNRYVINITGRHNEQEIISVEQAVRMFTEGSAYLSFEENCKGTLEVGKYADIIVLDQDIFEIDPEQIIDTKVDLTMINGEVVYKRTL